MIAGGTEIAERVATVRARIEKSAERAGRDPSDILLVAVTKTHGLDVIGAGYEAGLRHFGENRVEEARSKIVEAGQVLPHDVVWHMIGHVQSRKTDQVASLFPWVHSVDRLKIARRLSEEAREHQKSLTVLLEVNLSGEASKSGFALSGWPDNQAEGDAFLSEVQQIAQLPSLEVIGLMTMAPFSPDPETARPIFHRLLRLRERLRRSIPTTDWRHLSMGMSADFEVAIEEGATIVRLGTILFGPREG